MFGEVGQVDKVTPHQRSRNMAAVGFRDTKPELVVRHALHSMGLRFRLHQTSLPGSPDIVLKRHRTVILVHGCFWHGHSCPRGRPPATRLDFWLPKLERNRVRDRRQARQLRGLGWRVLTVWECQTKDPLKLARRLSRYFDTLID
ncbi:very short patch repair endonuclease [Paraburkholderia heleia]|uniref:very short patch repair endonuclease n=1 Tax=Paraburkholderia heleia TaxID=634127 RepID=UPI0031CEABB7